MSDDEVLAWYMAAGLPAASAAEARPALVEPDRESPMFRLMLCVVSLLAWVPPLVRTTTPLVWAVNVGYPSADRDAGVQADRSDGEPEEGGVKAVTLVIWPEELNVMVPAISRPALSVPARPEASWLGSRAIRYSAAVEPASLPARS